jgi:MtrB/PioB family decaheme-associated outer membrane protein
MHTQTNTATRASVAAVRAAIVALALAAVPATAAAQGANPTGTVEAGAIDTSQGSFKAGEYNGLQKKGFTFLGDAEIKSGTAYNSTSAFRWRVKAIDLGLATRNVFVQVGVQGKYRLRLTYDVLQRNRSDTYETPYTGAGTTTLLLPTTWLVPTVAATGGANTVSARGLVPSIGDAPYYTNSALTTPTAAQTTLVNAAAAADVPLFGNVNLATTRHRYDAAFNLILSPAWTFDADIRPEHKDGLQPMGSVTEQTGSLISTVIPIVIDNDNNQVTLGLTFKGKRSFLQGGYYGSFYKDKVTSMSWQNWAAPSNALNTITMPPSNNFNQATATGGFTFSPRTKLVASGSYSRNTQNDAYITNTTEPVVPVSSLNGLVVGSMFNAKFTTKPAKKLSLTAAYAYNERDNRTAINIYQYMDAQAPLGSPSTLFPAGPTNPLGALLATNANANRPYSKRANQVNVDADYAVAKGQWIKAGYDYERINRWCTGSWIDCADAALTNERTLRAEYRATLGSTLTARVNYANAERRAPNYNEDAFLALVPYANVCPTTSTGCVSALAFMTQNGWTGYGPSLGYAVTTGNMNVFFPNNNALPNTIYANNNRISELPGMERYYVADRNRNKVRTLLTWQPADQFTLQGRVDLNRDQYPSSTYGLQHSKGWSANLDGTYTPTDTLSLNVFYTYDNQQSTTAGNTYTANSAAATISGGQASAVGLSGNSCDGYTTLLQRNNNNKLDPCLNWSAAMLDKVNTLGFGVTKKAESLELTGTAILTRARGDNNVSGGNWANSLLAGSAAPPTTIAAYFIAAAPLPTVVTNSAEVRLNARYALPHDQSLHVAYAYLRMRSSDWAYDGMQLGTLNAQLPTFEQPFSYTVNVVSLSYVLRF